ncbi:MAG: replicative DNA helicase [Treponema sp.]|nr:replicative DNA helicase [Treponema sp.]
MNALKDKIPPHNLEAEEATLGALLLDWGAMSDVVTLLRPEKFYSLQNRIIFEALLELFNQNIHGDIVALTEQLTKVGKLDQAGGAAYIAALTDKVPTSANVTYYAGIVLEQSMRRDLIKVSDEMKATAFDDTKKTSDVMENAEKQIFALSDKNQTTQVHEMKTLVPTLIQTIEERYKNKNGFTGIPSGFNKLDTMTSGFQDSELIIIGARPSMGKTALALSMMQHITIDEHIPCGFFSLEMSSESVGQRLLSQEARIPGTKLRTGMLTMGDFQKLQDAAGRIYTAPLYIIDTPNMQLLDIRAMSRRLVLNHGVKIIFIDYIGLISTEMKNKETWEQVSEISKSLKALARELNIPIVALSQVARDAEGSEPNLAQIRGSGSIEQDADVVMFIHRERKKTEEGEPDPVQDAKIILAKQRNGPIGDINLLYLSSYTKFENKAKE